MSDESSALLKVLLDSLPTLLGVAVGALVGFLASWVLQKREFTARRLDKAREEVYGHLYNDLEQSIAMARNYNNCPGANTYDQIVRDRHLEWMIRDKGLRDNLRTLYLQAMPKFNEFVRSTIRLIREKLCDNLLRRICAADRQIAMDRDDHAAQKKKVSNLINDLTLPVLRGKLDIDNKGGRIEQFKMLHKWNTLADSLDDYFQRALEECRMERDEALKEQQKLIDKIKEIQRKIAKLLGEEE